MTDNLERLRHVRNLLKSGEYDGVDLEIAWLALDELQEAQDKLKKLRGLLDECVPKLMGDDYDYSETRICKACGYYSGHSEDCLVRRINEELA